MPTVNFLLISDENLAMKSALLCLDLLGTEKRMVLKKHNYDCLIDFSLNPHLK